ncbi:MAG: pyridoxal phosphate-dependent aminotransferase [Candidatus Omnitrophica bacterium]|nr:pyridoxal phosphate-dependent aminotransferase [Candidatus Omnitrophota bacterium]
MGKLKLSSRTEWVVRSEIRNMSIECDRIGGINLSQGIVDTEVPLVVRRGAHEAIDRGINTYTRHDGLKELRRAIALKVKRCTGLKYDPETEIVVSAGATGALYCACLALLNPGDEVIVFEPYYGYHITTLIAAEAVPKFVRLMPPDWAFTKEGLEKVVTRRTRAIIVNTPANPSGKVFSRKELEIIGAVAEKYDLFIFTDEIYEHFVYDGKKHIAPAAVKGLRKRVITISGLSKTFSITGWRIGYCLCDKKWAKPIGYFSDLIYVCAPAPLQMGVVNGLLKLGDEYYSSLKKAYHAKRDKICDALSKAGLKPYVPQGSYYVLADISRIKGRNSKERAMDLLTKTGVACVPGEAFYHDDAGEALARFCFAKNDKILDEACKRLERLAR